MSAADEFAISANGERILQILACREAGFDSLMGEVKISNHPLRRELKGLSKEQLIEKRIHHERRPGHPTEPYFLTERGRTYLAIKEEVRKLRDRLSEEYRARKITRRKRHLTLRAEYRRLGVTPPTHEEMRAEALSRAAGDVEKLGHNRIMLIETLDRRSLDVCRVHFFSKTTHILRKIGKGFFARYLIEPRITRPGLALRKSMSSNQSNASSDTSGPPSRDVLS